MSSNVSYNHTKVLFSAFIFFLKVKTTKKALHTFFIEVHSEKKKLRNLLKNAALITYKKNNKFNYINTFFFILDKNFIKLIHIIN